MPPTAYPPIYAPEGRAAQYAAWACNPYAGCGCGCVYCYVPDWAGMTRPAFDAGAEEKPFFREALRRDAARLQARGLSVQAMIGFQPGGRYRWQSFLKYACLLAERGQQIARVQGKLAQVHRRLEADMLEPTDFVVAGEFMGGGDHRQRLRYSNHRRARDPGPKKSRPHRNAAASRSLTGAALRSYLAEYASFADVSVTA